MSPGQRLPWGVRRFTLGPLRVNTYVVAGEGECLVVDPGACRGLLESLAGMGCRVGVALVTHGHFDHVAGVPCLASRGFQVAGHPMAPEWALEFARWARSMGLDVPLEPFNLDLELRDGAALEVAGLRLEAFYTPGHSPDHIVYLERRLGLAFTGDLIFRGSVGRDDIPGGSPEELARSLTRLVGLLSPRHLLLPGHGPETTLGEELALNRLLRLYVAMGTHDS